MRFAARWRRRKGDESSPRRPPLPDRRTAARLAAFYDYLWSYLRLSFGQTSSVPSGARLIEALHPGGAQMVKNRFIDPDLLTRALKVSGERTKRAVVERALREFVARREQKGLLDLFGKLEWDRTDDKLERSRN